MNQANTTFIFGVALVSGAAVVLGPTGCSRNDPSDPFVFIPDAAPVPAEAAPSVVDAAPVEDPTLGGPCSEDAQCNDRIACTYDRCDLSVGRCRSTPDDTQCDDGTYCNGAERCLLLVGCVPGAVVTCDDGTTCTLDRCVEATRSCEYAPRDLDGDGDTSDHCVPNGDCDDTDPTVSRTRAEICGNGKDDNCNGQIDETPCVTAEHDTCSTALSVTGSSAVSLSTVAAKMDYAPSCSVSTPTAARDAVIAIIVPAGPPQDIFVRARTVSPLNEIAVSLQTTCGQTSSEVTCVNLPFSTSARSLARSVAGGTTLYAIVTTQLDSEVDVSVEFLPATSKPSNEDCASASSVPLGTPFTVSFVDASTELTTACDGGRVGELTYAFTLAEPRDVRIYATTLLGEGEPIVSLRAPGCASERTCAVGSTRPVFARNLPAGTHVLAVSATGQIDASVLVQTAPPTSAPLEEQCAMSPPLTHGEARSVDFSNNEGTIKNGCLDGRPTAAFALDLAAPSDVLLIGRFPFTDLGALSLSRPGCTASDTLTCFVGYTPQRLSLRNLAPGSYRAVISDDRALSGELLALVRPTIPPVTVTADDCTNAHLIPETGGFFTGDTTSASANFSAGCDMSTQGLAGARDQLLRLTLSQARRVVFDMSGSAHTTLLSVRAGSQCPGIEVAGGCSPGLSISRSFLDLSLSAGTYWIQVDGYAGSVGRWNLDVRVLPP